MSSVFGRAPDRRHHIRLEPKGSVAVHALGGVHRGRLVNISAGGVYAATASAVPDGLLGRVVDVELRLDGQLAAWQQLAGRVGRIDAGGFAVVLDEPRAPALLRMLDDLDTASSASARIVSVVLVDIDPARRATVADGFRAAGCVVVVVATPLEAIVRLGESHFEPDVIAVADVDTGAAAAEMRAFVAREHPNAMLVAVGHELLAPAGLANWLSSATSPTELAVHVRDLLFGRADAVTAPG